MKTSSETSISHLQWAVDNRNENLQCAIKLLKLLREHSDKIKQRKLDVFAQALVGITFSLWRAAFLADKSGLRAESFEAAKTFLETLIADNAINYSEDKRKREWTFNYYVNNASNVLINWHGRPNVRHLVPEWKRKIRSPKERWEYAQKLLTLAVANFAEELQ